MLCSAVDDLSGQTALVSGGGRGIGRDIAVALAAAGVSVGLIGRTAETLRDTAQLITTAGGSAKWAVADVTDAGGLPAAVASLVDSLGAVDLLVSNAGARESAGALPWSADPGDWWRVVQTNLRGPFLLAHAVLPAMVSRGAGRVLHVGSGMGLRPHPEWSAYGVSKAALTRFTESLAVALQGTGVCILEASPGLVRTDMTESMWGPADQQVWNPSARLVDLTLRFARGDLDTLHGRFVHAARDDLDGLLAMAEQIGAGDARTLRLQTFGPQDPLA